VSHEPEKILEMQFVLVIVWHFLCFKYALQLYVCVCFTYINICKVSGLHIYK
jgi:hypothetical protein